MQELQRRIDGKIEKHHVKKPKEFRPFILDGVEVKLKYLFMGRNAKSELVLLQRDILSRDTISNSRKRIIAEAKIKDGSITPRHFRSGCANMLHYLAVLEAEWMDFSELQVYLRHKEFSGVTQASYVAARCDKDVWERWGKLSKKQRKAIVTHTCFVRV